MVHLNTSGTTNGKAACGEKGMVCDNEAGVTCPACLQVVEAREIKRALYAPPPPTRPTSLPEPPP